MFPPQIGITSYDRRVRVQDGFGSCKLDNRLTEASIDHRSLLQTVYFTTYRIHHLHQYGFAHALTALKTTPLLVKQVVNISNRHYDDDDVVCNMRDELSIQLW